MAPRQHLEETIAHLRQELASGAPLSKADRALLDRTLSEIAVHLGDENPATVLAGPLYDELRQLAVGLEKSRPNLSILVGRIVDALSQLGI